MVLRQAKCQEKSLYQVEKIVEKKDKMKRLRNGQRTGKPCVHYKVKWAGAQWEGHDTWEPLENLQAPPREGDGERVQQVYFLRVELRATCRQQ